MALTRDAVFWSAFRSHARAEPVRATRHLKAMFEDPDQVKILAGEITKAEQDGDRITHETVAALHQTWITPLDREDIYELAKTLDDVMDAIDASATMINLYRIQNVRPRARELVRTIVESTDQIVHGVRALDKRDGVAVAAVEINRLENEADRIHKEAVRTLFEDVQIRSSS